MSGHRDTTGLNLKGTWPVLALMGLCGAAILLGVIFW